VGKPRQARYRPILMRRTLGSLVLALFLPLALTACGSDRGAAKEPDASGPVAFDQVAVVSGSAAGGPGVDPQPTVLADERAVAAYAGRFRGSLPGDLTAAAKWAEPSSDQVLVAAVVAVGCEPPTQVHARMLRGRLTVTATPVVSRKECFAPVTSVALLLVPQAAV
jgi:predicted small lipoprotein YifL